MPLSLLEQRVSNQRAATREQDIVREPLTIELVRFLLSLFEGLQSCLVVGQFCPLTKARQESSQRGAPAIPRRCASSKRLLPTSVAEGPAGDG
jgi:hypothetical protein